VFRAWGRIGTTSGGHQTDPQVSKEDAIDLFCEKYEEKTKNAWGAKFVKKPGMYVALDIDYGQVKCLIQQSCTNSIYYLHYIACSFVFK